MKQSIIKDEKIKILFSILLIFVSIFFLYQKVLHFKFSGLDDVNMVQTSAKAYESKTAIIDAFKTDVLFGLAPTPYYRPLVVVSFIVDNRIAGDSEEFAHFTSILLHCIASILFFIFLRRYIFKNTLFSFLAAMLFAVHPASSYGAAWITGRNESILFINFLFAFGFFIEYINKKKFCFLIGNIFFLILCYFTKESAISFPFILFIYYLLTKDKDTKLNPIIYLLWIISIFFFLYIRKLAIPSSGVPVNLYQNINKDTVSMIFEYYMSIFFFKILFGVSLKTQHIILGSIGILLSFFFAFFGQKDKKKLKSNLFYFLMPFFMLAPQIAAGDRLWYQGNRIYIILFPIIILFFSFIEYYSQNEKFKKAVLPLTIVLILFASSITWSKVNTFKNSLSFWGAILGESQYINITANKFYVYALIEAGEYKKALNIAFKISKITGFSNNELNSLLAYSYFMNGDFQNSAKIFESLLKSNFDVFQSAMHLTIAYYVLGEEDKFQSTLNYLTQISGKSREATLSTLNQYLVYLQKTNVYFKFKQ